MPVRHANALKLTTCAAAVSWLKMMSGCWKAIAAGLTITGWAGNLVVVLPSGKLQSFA